MARHRLHIAALLLLVLAIVCSSSSSSSAVVAPTHRLRNLEQTTTSTNASVPQDSTSTNATADSGAAKHAPVHKAPTTMSFVGPVFAGVLAIVLIGAVIAFKNRSGN